MAASTLPLRLPKNFVEGVRTTHGRCPGCIPRSFFSPRARKSSTLNTNTSHSGHARNEICQVSRTPAILVDMLLPDRAYNNQCPARAVQCARQAPSRWDWIPRRSYSPIWGPAGWECLCDAGCVSGCVRHDFRGLARTVHDVSCPASSWICVKQAQSLAKSSYLVFGRLLVSPVVVAELGCLWGSLGIAEASHLSKERVAPSESKQGPAAEKMRCSGSQ